MFFYKFSTILLFTYCVLGAEANYGVDYSYPIHHQLERDKSPFFYDRYQSYMKGCYNYYSKAECDACEYTRIDMNLNQPKGQHNYTKIGFKKMKVPESAWKPLVEFFEANKKKEKVEDWPKGYSYVNHWDNPSYMVSFEDRFLRGGLQVKEQIWNGIKPIIEEWTGHSVHPTSLYGIRVYKEGAILATHVDRLPLVSSAIINVGQDVNEPWPVEVYDHDGNAYNVTMEPGDMVLYESHTVLHGRPFPLNGSFFANCFVHFEPDDHSDMNKQDEEKFASKRDKNSGLFSIFKNSNKENIGGHEQSNHDEATYRKHLERLRNGPEEPNSEEENEMLRVQMLLRKSIYDGDFDSVIRALGPEDFDTLHFKDENDWQLIHEAVRSGNITLVKHLVRIGADLSSRVKAGGAALFVARKFLSEDHPVTKFLIEIGAPSDDEL